MDRVQERGPTPIGLSAADWRSVLKRAWREASKDNIGLIAAGVSFYAFFALAPLLAALVLVYGLFADPRGVVEDVGTLMAILPAEAAKLIGDLLLNAVQGSDGKKGLAIVIALALALFGARNGAGSILTALNIAYEEEEKRGWFSLTVTALAMTVGAVVGSLILLATISGLTLLESLAPGLPAVSRIVVQALTFLLLATVATLGMAALYRFGPSREKPRWSWTLPGSLFSALFCIILSLGFAIYVSNFGNYDVAYGSVGAVIVLLTWMYLTFYIFLFGAELNAELEHQVAADTTTGAPLPMGERGAWAADNVVEPEDAITDREEGRLPAPQPDDLKEHSISHGRHFLFARASSWVMRRIGAGNVGMLSSALSTAGLGLLRKRGHAWQGLTVLGAASGLAVLSRYRSKAEHRKT